MARGIGQRFRERQTDREQILWWVPFGDHRRRHVFDNRLTGFCGPEINSAPFLGSGAVPQLIFR
jgi:hypothetical protein